MSLDQLAANYDSGHSSSEGSNSSNSAHSTSVVRKSSPKRPRLEVPAEISTMFSMRGWVNNSSDHSGRTRNFEHEQGVWASYFFVQACDSECIDDLQKMSSALSPSLCPIEAEKCHISLSKTLKCRFHWIKPLYSHVRQTLQTRKPFLVSFSRFAVYENEEKTSVFLGIDVDLGNSELQELSKKVDSALDHFRLPNFYSQPRYHMTISWAPYHQRQSLISSLPELQLRLDEYCCSVEFAGVVDKLCFRSGCKLFEIPLGFEIPSLQFQPPLHLNN